MANALITPQIIAREALMQVENNLMIANKVHREYKKEFNVKVGDDITIRRPVRYVVTDGATMVKQDTEEGTTTLTINKRKHVAMSFTTQDLTLKIGEFSERYIQPAAIQLANQIDSDVFDLYQKVWNHVGTPGTTPATFLNVAEAAQRLDDMAVPDDGRRSAFFNPEAGYKIANDVKDTFIQAKNRTALEKGTVGSLATFETFRAQNVKTHTVGVATGTPLVDGAAQETTYALSKTTNTQLLVTDGWTNSTTGILLAGDVITIAGVFAVNPVGRETLPFLQQFTVIADADSGATTGPATLTISPAIITSGPYQTVSAGPADNAAITVVTGTGGTGYPQNMCFHRNAFALVTVPLIMPDGASFKARETHKGISLRLIKDYDITPDEENTRLDVLYGVKAIYPDLATRLTG